MLYLEGSDGSRLEPEISLEVLGDLPDEALEGQLADQELGGLLVPPDLTEGHCAGPNHSDKIKLNSYLSRDSYPYGICNRTDSMAFSVRICIRNADPCLFLIFFFKDSAVVKKCNIRQL